MLRLLLLLLFSTAVSAFEEEDASGYDTENDDEDDLQTITETPSVDEKARRNYAGNSKNVEDKEGLATTIIIATVATVTLTAAAVIATVVIRKHRLKQQQGMYVTPSEQIHKGTV